MLFIYSQSILSLKHIYMSIIKQMMSSTSHWPVNKDFVRSYGWHAAIMMTHLVDKWAYFGFPEEFYSEIEDAEKDICLSGYQQAKAIEVLIGEGFISQSNRGTPMRRNFHIHEAQILSFFNSSFQVSSKLDFKKLENYSSSFSNTLNKNKNNNKEQEQKQPINSNYQADLKAMKLGIIKILKKNLEDFDQIVEPIDMSIREIGEAFSDYWVIGQGRQYSSRNVKGLCTSFREWARLSDAPDLKRAQNESLIGKQPSFAHLMDKLKRVGKFEPNASERQELSSAVENVDHDTIDRAVSRFQNSPSVSYKDFLSILKSVITEKELLG